MPDWQRTLKFWFAPGAIVVSEAGSTVNGAPDGLAITPSDAVPRFRTFTFAVPTTPWFVVIASGLGGVESNSGAAPPPKRTLRSHLMGGPPRKPSA